MRIGILTTAINKKENNRLIEAAHKRGHTTQLLHVLKCSISVCPNSPEVYYEGKPIGQAFDIIIPRIDGPDTEYALTILRQFESMNIFTSESAHSLELGHDKLQCTQRLLREGVPFPATGFAYSKEDFDNIINIVGGTPLVIKQVDGRGGTGVFLADDMKHAVNLLKTFKQIETPLIMQKFIEESTGIDLRAYVIGGKIIATMQRQSQDGDFRTNTTVGGHNSVAILSKIEQEIVLRASKAIGINVAGVDLIRSNNGPLVLNICTSVDFAGARDIEKLSDVDIADETIRYAVRANSNKTTYPKQAA